MAKARRFLPKNERLVKKGGLGTHRQKWDAGEIGRRGDKRAGVGGVVGKDRGVEARWNTTGASLNRAVLATRCYE
jgi:hypothetical protein